MTEQTLWVRVSGGALVPADSDSKERLNRVRDGTLVMVRAKAPRNPKQHRLLWHLARMIHENSESFESAEHVVEQMKIGTGLTDRMQLTIPGIGVVIQERGKSITFESMPQSEFEDWFERVLDYTVVSLLPGVSKDEIRAIIEEKAIGGLYNQQASGRVGATEKGGQTSRP